MRRIKLLSVQFNHDVILPGSGSSNTYLPGEDFRISLLPDLGVVEAKVKPHLGVRQGQPSTRWYGTADIRGAVPDESALPAETAVTEDASGALTVPQGRMATNENGVFERVVDDPAVTIEHVAKVDDAIAHVTGIVPKRGPGRPRKVTAGE